MKSRKEIEKWQKNKNTKLGIEFHLKWLYLMLIIVDQHRTVSLIDLRGYYVLAGFPQSYRLKFTKQELEQAGFGCVFGNQMFEV